MLAGWGNALKGLQFARVFSSPLQRGKRTCELAGFGSRAEVDRDLVEWNYGEYEGLRTADIRAKRPDRGMFRDGFPGGESFDQIAAPRGPCCGTGSIHWRRSAPILERALSSSPGGAPARNETTGRPSFSTGHRLSSLTYEHNLSQPAIGLWNETDYVSGQPLEESK